MAGFRVDEPIGPQWEYSLDAMSYQASRVFDGLVIGMLYTIYCRHIPTGAVIWEQVRVGDLVTGWVTPTAAQADAIIDIFSEDGIDRLLERLAIPDADYIAPDDAELAELKERLDIPEPIYVAPEGNALDELLDALNRRRRGGLGPVPLSETDAVFLAWQLAPIIGFEPIVAKPANYHDQVDALTARSIARQIVFSEWGFEFDLLGLPVRIVLEQAEVTVLSAQLAPLFGFDKYVAPTLLEQLNELSDDILEAIRLRINVRAPSFMDQFRATTDTERLEIRDIIPCCEDGGTGPVVPAMNLAVIAQYEPTSSGPDPNAPVLFDYEVVQQTDGLYLKTFAKIASGAAWYSRAYRQGQTPTDFVQMSSSGSDSQGYQYLTESVFPFEPGTQLTWEISPNGSTDIIQIPITISAVTARTNLYPGTSVTGQNFIELKNTGGDPNNVGWPQNQTRYYVYALSLTCQAAEAQFNGLTPAQKVAQTVTGRPAGSYQVRTCGGTTPDPGPDPEIPSDPNDQANETDIQYRQL
jgi:hypothetical protein